MQEVFDDRLKLIRTDLEKSRWDFATNVDTILEGQVDTKMFILKSVQGLIKQGGANLNKIAPAVQGLESDMGAFAGIMSFMCDFVEAQFNRPCPVKPAMAERPKPEEEGTGAEEEEEDQGQGETSDGSDLGGIGEASDGTPVVPDSVDPNYGDGDYGFGDPGEEEEEEGSDPGDLGESSDGSSVTPDPDYDYEDGDELVNDDAEEEKEDYVYTDEEIEDARKQLELLLLAGGQDPVSIAETLNKLEAMREENTRKRNQPSLPIQNRQSVSSSVRMSIQESGGDSPNFMQTFANQLAKFIT